MTAVVMLLDHLTAETQSLVFVLIFYSSRYEKCWSGHIPSAPCSLQGCLPPSSLLLDASGPNSCWVLLADQGFLHHLEFLNPWYAIGDAHCSSFSFTDRKLDCFFNSKRATNARTGRYCVAGRCGVLSWHNKTSECAECETPRPRRSVSLCNVQFAVTAKES